MFHLGGVVYRLAACAVDIISQNGTIPISWARAAVDIDYESGSSGCFEHVGNGIIVFVKRSVILEPHTSSRCSKTVGCLVIRYLESFTLAATSESDPRVTFFVTNIPWCYYIAVLLLKSFFELIPNGYIAWIHLQYLLSHKIYIFWRSHCPRIIRSNLLVGMSFHSPVPILPFCFSTLDPSVCQILWPKARRDVLFHRDILSGAPSL